MTSNLRAADLTMAHRVATTLEALPLEDGDAAMRRLALDYAEAIDGVPMLLAGEWGETAAAIRDERVKVLDRLQLGAQGASPRARAAIASGKPAGRKGAASRLHEARQAAGQ